jgi:predicted Fe-S protein YdhL (DUF1289 family)
MSKRMIKSPCVDVCKMDKLSGLCRGCLRTIPEIKAWKGLSRKEQKALLADLDGRLARLDQPLIASDSCP